MLTAHLELCDQRWVQVLDLEALLDHLVAIQIGVVVGLVLLGDTVQGLADRVLGRGVKHLRLDAAVVGGPEDEDDLVLGAAVPGFVVQIIHHVAGFVLR